MLSLSLGLHGLRFRSASSGAPPTAFRAEVTAYETRYNSFGETLSTAGKQSLQDTLDLMDAEAVVLSRAYLFGSEANLPASHGRALEMTGASPTADFVQDAGPDSYLFTTPGIMTLEGGTSGQGYLASGEALADNTDWTMLVYASRSLLNLLAPGSSSHTPSLISQYTATSAGNWLVNSGSTGGYSLNALSGAAVTIQAASTGQTLPIATFFCYVAATKTWSVYNAMTGALLGTSTQTAVINTAALTRLGQHQRAVEGSPRCIQYGALFKWTGILTGPQMTAVWAGLHPIILRHANLVWSPGNSVTSHSSAAQDGADASPIGVAAAWPHTFGRWAAKNNCWYLRFSGLSSRTLYQQRPASWVDATNVAARISVPVMESARNADAAAVYRPNVVLNDEQQNTAGLDPDITYADFKSVRDQMVTVATANAVRPVKLVQPTQMAIRNTSYAAALADSKSNKLRDFSVAIRIDADVDAVAELYGAFNQGWGSGDDGNAADPLNDLPNGLDSWFLWNAGTSGDSIHPNTAGHAQLASLYQAAVLSVI